MAQIRDRLNLRPGDSSLKDDEKRNLLVSALLHTLDTNLRLRLFDIFLPVRAATFVSSSVRSAYLAATLPRFEGECELKNGIDG